MGTTRARRSFPLYAQILTGLVVGAVIGFAWPDFGKTLQPIGTAFIKAIKMIVIPLVFCAISLGISKMSKDIKQLGRLGGLAFLWFYTATGFAIVIGITLNHFFHPAQGVALEFTGTVPANLASHIDWTKFFLDIIPDNIIMAAANQKLIPVLFFAICFGLCIGMVGKKGECVIAGMEGILEAMFKMTKGVVATSPLAVAAIIAWAIASQGTVLLLAMGKLIGVFYIGIVILVCVFMVILKLLGVSPMQTTKKILEPLLLGFTTCSSEVTLPVHMEILERSGIPKRVVSFVIPLGYSFNLDGAALYQSLAITFLAELYGLHLDGPQLLTILITTLIANKGAANVPAAALVVIAVLCQTLGLPVEAIGIITGVDRFMDMGRTFINVYGNTVACIVLNKFGGGHLADSNTRESMENA